MEATFCLNCKDGKMVIVTCPDSFKFHRKLFTVWWPFFIFVIVDELGCSRMSELQFFEGNSFSSRESSQPALLPVSSVKSYISPAGKITKRNFWILEAAVSLGSRYNMEEFCRLPPDDLQSVAHALCNAVSAWPQRI